MFFIKISDIRGFLLFGLNVFSCFFLPDFRLNLIPPFLFLLSKSFVFHLLQKVILGSNSLGKKSILSPLLISKLRLLSSKILGKNSFILFFLLLFVILDNGLSHHVHELPLSPFPVRHLVSSFLLLSRNKSCVLFLGFNIPLSLKLLFLLLHNFIFLIILKHLSEATSFLLLPGNCLFLFLTKFLFDLSNHSLVEVLFLLKFKSLSEVFISELLVSGELLLV